MRQIIYMKFWKHVDIMFTMSAWRAEMSWTFTFAQHPPSLSEQFSVPWADSPSVSAVALCTDRFHSQSSVKKGVSSSNWPGGMSVEELYWLVMDVGRTSTLRKSTIPRQVSLGCIASCRKASRGSHRKQASFLSWSPVLASFNGRL